MIELWSYKNFFLFDLKKNDDDDDDDDDDDYDHSKYYVL